MPATVARAGTGVHRRTAAGSALTASRIARHIPVAAIAEHLTIAAASVALLLLRRPRTESILAAGRLTNGEVGRGARGRRLIVETWQLRANQLTMHRAFFAQRLIVVALIVTLVVAAAQCGRRSNRLRFERRQITRDRLVVDGR